MRSWRKKGKQHLDRWHVCLRGIFVGFVLNLSLSMWVIRFLLETGNGWQEWILVGAERWAKTSPAPPSRSTWVVWEATRFKLIPGITPDKRSNSKTLNVEALDYVLLNHLIYLSSILPLHFRFSFVFSQWLGGRKSCLTEIRLSANITNSYMSISIMGMCEISRQC